MSEHTGSSGEPGQEVEQEVVDINQGDEEEEKKEGDGEEEGEEQVPPEYTPPLSAVPPRVMPQEESQIEVSASPAFQCLDDVSFRSFLFRLSLCDSIFHSRTS